MKRLLILSIMIALACLVGWQVYQKSLAAKKPTDRSRKAAPVAVEIMPVKEISISDIRKFIGTLHPVSQFVVAPKISGRLKAVPFNIGDKVKKGQLIAVLEDEEYLQEVDQSQAELEVARANLDESRNMLENARREQERTVVLRQKKIASESDLDTAESNYRTQEAKLKVALAQLIHKESSLKVAQVRLSYTRIKMARGENSGNWVVGERYVNEGAMMAPNTPIVSLLDIGSVIAAIHVIERDYAGMQTGMKAVASTDAFPDRTFTGKVVRIAPLLKEKSRQARVEVEIPNEEENLKPGMFVRVLIEFGQRDSATVVPSRALIKRDGAEGVFLADTKATIARFIPVVTGIVNGGHTEILSPKISGAVVTLGHHLLEDGSTLILPSGSPEGSVRKKSGQIETGKAGKQRP